MGDAPSGVVARRTCRSGVTRPRTPEPCTVILVNITSVQGGAREPQSGLPDGAAAGGVVQFLNKVVDVPVVVPPVRLRGLLPGRVLQRFVSTRTG